MAAQTLSVMCCLIAMIQNAACSLVLDVSPTEIYLGLTQSLTVNCTFSPNGVSSIVGPISLIIAKENQQEQFDDLLSVNIYSPDEPTKTDLLRSGIVTGHISGDDQSFLTIQWSSPTASESGLYRCEINGVDSTGHPTQSSQTMMVTSQKPSTDQLTNKVSDLQQQLDGQDTLVHNLQHQLDRQVTLNQNQSQTINTLLSLTQTQSNMITTLLNTTTDLREKLELQNIFFPFHLSIEYKGHYYLLSKLDWKDSKVSEQTCEAYGGYLVEINDSDEQEFVRGFLDHLDGFQYVLISGTQEGHSGIWTYTYSGGQLTYTNWNPGEPDAASNLCIITTRSSSWQWFDHQCTHTYINERFMCEVNIN